MRTFEEINADVKRADDSDDAPMLMRLADELLELITPEADASAYVARGLACFCTGDNSLALENYNRALALYSKLGDRRGVATVTGNISTIYGNTGDYPTALEHCKSVLALYRELGDRRGMAAVTGNMGNIYGNTGDYPAALEHYNSALALCHEIGNRRGIAALTGNLGNIYNSIGDYPTALEHYNRSLALSNELGERRGVANATSSIGNVYMNTGDYAAALEQYTTTLDIRNELSDRIGIASATGNIGSVYNSKGDYPAALEHYKRSLTMFNKHGDLDGEVFAIGGILQTLLHMADVDGARQTLANLDELHIDNPREAVGREAGRANIQILEGDLSAANTTLTNALELAVTHGLRAQQADVRKELRDLAQKRNDFAAYIEHNNEYTRVNEEIRGKETSIKLAMQAKERELEEKDKEHAKHMAVLHSTLPKHIADRVARGEVVNDKHECVAVLFLDLVGFTTMSSSMDATDVVALLERIFALCDATMNTHGLMKIKTICDSYMAVAFDNIHNAAHAALELASAIAEVPVRIGIHCGPVVAGVLGKERMQYDVWGDTVNIASRMESTSEPGRVHVSAAFAKAVEEKNVREQSREDVRESRMLFVERGEIDVKGKGMMKTFWLELHVA
ncbi:hypothetical protein BH10BAC6_BH10BAC6_05790 [soil metagenome]